MYLIGLRGSSLPIIVGLLYIHWESVSTEAYPVLCQSVLSSGRMYVCYSTYPYGQPYGQTAVTPVAAATEIAPSYLSAPAPTIQPAITEPILVPVTATPQGITAALQSLPIAVCRKVFHFCFISIFNLHICIVLRLLKLPCFTYFSF